METRAPGPRTRRIGGVFGLETSSPSAARALLGSGRFQEFRMDREQIMAIEAGPEMDRAIEESVYGWKPITSEDHYRADFKPYSTDIAAAWEVVERMRTMNKRLSLLDHGGEYHANFFTSGEYQLYNNACADTVSLAVCRAALLRFPIPETAQ